VAADGRLDDFGDRLAGLGVSAALRGAGGLVLRDLPPGDYELEVGRRPAAPLRLLADDQRPEDYDDRVLGQALRPGFGYVETRDGTRLSVNIALPDPDRWGDGPHATLLLYSAYDDSRTDFLTDDPGRDTGMNTEANVGLLLGFAVVGLNARGTGASGGAFRMFDRIVGLDGHDVVEALAVQPWCRSVGMIGRSGPGFFQLRVAATAPPSLAAITPAAVLRTSFGTGRRPGGLVNSWVVNRLSGWAIEEVDGLPPGAAPPRYDPEGWDGWVTARLQAGEDEVAIANQLLRGQTITPMQDFVVHRDPAADERTAPMLWAPNVACPTLLVGSWQDQESGPGWAELIEDFPEGTEVRLFGSNGTHEETRYPESVAVWAGFLSERLRGEPLVVTPEAEAYLGAAVAPQVGADDLPIGPPAPVGRVGGAYVRLENGAGPGGPGRPTAADVLELDAWPPSGHREVAWPLGDGDGDDTVVEFRYDPSIRPPSAGGRPGFDVNAPGATYDWRPLPTGYGQVFVGPPIERDTLLCGPSSLELWLGCTAPDVDLEVTLTEVRPDGWETYVQSGWLRASHRHLDPALSTRLRPVPTYQAVDAEPLPAGVLSPLQVPIESVAHRLRPGSRLAVRVEPPGGVLPSWTFDPLWPDGRHDGAPVVVRLGVGGSTPSRLVVPLLDLDGVLPPTPLPPPGALRRQPSRPITD
jgi:predicted acyl esterase